MSVELTDIVNEFVYVVPWEKYVYRVGYGAGDSWALGAPVGKDGITNHLLERGYPEDLVAKVLKSRSFIRVYGYEMEPNRPALFENDSGLLVANLWKPPTLKPKPGAYPSIQTVLDFVTKGDAEGQRWLKMWMAWKARNPGLVPKVCVVITSEPGAGKGTLACVMSHILGPENCDAIQREHLENKFNARWVQKLFVLGDEILSTEKMKDISNSLKIYIDSNTIELEAKFQNQRTVRNHLAWMFASNDPVSPVVIEKNDRRYSVFSNHNPVTLEYRRMFLSLFEADRVTPTPAFLDEIAAFYHDLLAMDLDVEWVSKPYDNEARSRLIEASMPSHQAFLRYVDENGIDDLLDQLKEDDFDFKNTAKEWDQGEKGITTAALYKCYTDFCRRNGTKALRNNKFGAAVKSHLPEWPHVRLTIPDTDKRPWGYKVPRRPRPDDVPTPHLTTDPARATLFS